MQQGIIEKNHMDILWHDYALNKEDTIPITKAGLIEKASVVGRCGMMLLSCGTGAWRVRSSIIPFPENWESPVPPTLA